MKKGFSLLVGIMLICSIFTFGLSDATMAEAATRITVSGGSVGGS